MPAPAARLDEAGALRLGAVTVGPDLTVSAGGPAGRLPPGCTVAAEEVRVLGLPGGVVVSAGGRAVLVCAPGTPAFGDPLSAPLLDAVSGAAFDAVVLTGPAEAGALAAVLSALRRAGAVVATTDVAVPTTVGVAASDRRLAAWGVRRVAAAVLGGAPPLPGRTLVLGPAESGKSAHAEDLLAAEGDVVYLAPGPAPGPDDPDWAARVRRHRDRRPPTWTTLETAPDAADRVTADAELRRPGPALLLDSIGTWLSGQMAEAGAFDGNPGAARWLDDAETGLVDAWRRSPRRLVAVAEETGWGVVPATPAGRLFRERLGRLTRRLADGATVHLVVAGRVCPLQEW